jgi:hypothetical protein
MKELLTPCALGRHGASLVRFYSDFDITQVGQLRNLLALWDVVELSYVHGQRHSLSPRGHWDDILNCKSKGSSYSWVALGGVVGRMLLITTLYGLGSLCLMRLKGTAFSTKKLCKFG